MGDTEEEASFGLCKRSSPEGSDCDKPAQFYPVLALRPKGYIGEPARVCLKLGICIDHAIDSNPEIYIGEQSWKLILQVFDREKLVRPHRASTVLEMHPIEDVDFDRMIMTIGTSGELTKH